MSTLIIVLLLLIIITIIVGYYLGYEGSDIGEQIGSAVTGVVVGVVKTGVSEISDAGEFNTRQLGEECKAHAQCIGWEAATAGTPGCCNDVCTKLEKDWTGIGYCPDVCQDAPSPLGKPGSCNSGNTWPRSKGQPCDTDVACDGFKPGQQSLACDQGICEDQQKDWTGIWWKPSVCQDAPSPLGKPGSCNSGNTWPRSRGQPCDTLFACKSEMCYNGKCVECIGGNRNANLEGSGKECTRNCQSGFNKDPNGKCWTCNGWKRTIHSVDSNKACIKDSCDSGFNKDPNGKCWTCDGWDRTWHSVDSNKACVEKWGALFSPERAARFGTPWNAERAAKFGSPWLYSWS